MISHPATSPVFIETGQRDWGGSLDDLCGNDCEWIVAQPVIWECVAS